MFGGLMLLGSLLASAEEPLPKLEARWTRDTIPAIAVHLTSTIAHQPIAGARVVFRGPDGTAFESTSKADGVVSRGFLTAGFWQISVHAPRGIQRTVWVELQPRQRADVEMELHPGTIVISEQPLHAPVVDPSRAARGAVFRMGSLVARPK
ncbi:MAG: hypothetical protein CL927_02075 [Deltaproteobacteria bacterium]|nr:hypothetical protein [Deltaproteobacteria bacterium]HCH62056.1 hypothetical protein [Deltaproteobacteria bacterium]